MRPGAVNDQEYSSVILNFGFKISIQSLAPVFYLNGLGYYLAEPELADPNE
jgi:hypothetical protein